MPERFRGVNLLNLNCCPRILRKFVDTLRRSSHGMRLSVYSGCAQFSSIVVWCGLTWLCFWLNDVHVRLGFSCWRFSMNVMHVAATITVIGMVPFEWSNHIVCTSVISGSFVPIPILAGLIISILWNSQCCMFGGLNICQYIIWRWPSLPISTECVVPI